MKTWLGILTAIVVVLSVAVVSAYCNGISYSDIAASVLISALGVMVTALVGWQVYNAISYDKRISVIEELAKKNALYGDARICFTQGVIIYTITSTQSSQDNPILLNNYSIAYRNFLEALIKHHSSEREVKPIISCFDNMESCLKKIEDAHATFKDSIFTQCDNLYNDFIFREKELRVSQEMLTRLSNLNSRRKALASNLPHEAHKPSTEARRGEDNNIKEG